MAKKEENKIEINMLLEIIYERYREDVRGGKLRVELSEGYKQAVGKSAQKAETFHQPAFDYGK